MERLSAANPWSRFVSVDPDRLGGEPVFRGTRVPIRILFEYLEGGYTVPKFLDDFDGVDAAQVTGVLELTSQGLRDALLGEANRGAA